MKRRIFIIFLVCLCVIIHFSFSISNFSTALTHCRPTCMQRGSGFMKAGVSQRFGRAIHLQICTKVSAGIHPRFHKTARCRQCIFLILLLPPVNSSMSVFQHCIFSHIQLYHQTFFSFRLGNVLCVR